MGSESLAGAVSAGCHGDYRDRVRFILRLARFVAKRERGGRPLPILRSLENALEARGNGMNHYIALFTATSVLLWLLYRVAAIVRESASEATSKSARDAASKSLSGVVMDGIVTSAGRLVVLLGTAFAITCAVALVRSPALSAPSAPKLAAPQAEIVRLEPVVVTGSRARFQAIRAEQSGDTQLAERRPSASHG
jgi:hypothetical protein